MICSKLIELNIKEDMEADEVLSPLELELYGKMMNENRKREFLVGRYAIKKNLEENFPSLGLQFNQVTVEYGTFRYPIIKDKCIEVGLSHSKNYAFSIIYSKDEVVGVDIETIGTSKVIEKLLTVQERGLISENTSLSKFAYIFFSCKEALGKALKIGLLADYSIYEIKNVTLMASVSQELYQVHFKNFPFLKAFSFIKNEMEVCTIVVSQTADTEELLGNLLDSERYVEG
ncbi:4'-phosphopantetheinyl transferase family protein [Actinomycetes bacterium NPDC127524]